MVRAHPTVPSQADTSPASGADCFGGAIRNGGGSDLLCIAPDIQHLKATALRDRCRSRAQYKTEFWSPPIVRPPSVFLPMLMRRLTSRWGLDKVAAMLSATIFSHAIFQPAIARVLGCILAFAFCFAEANAKGGSYQTDPPYNSQHISSLPPEIRALVYASCNEPRALHTFAEYRDNLRFVTLHFERLLCGNSEFRCPASGCLHEVFALTRSGRYQLTRRYYAKEPRF